MTRIQRLARAALLGGLIGAAAVSAQAQSRDPVAATAPGASAYDGLIASAKASMMADPSRALLVSRQALALVRGSAGEEALHTATARWLEGEALLRLNRAQEAQPAIEEALAIASAEAPDSNFHGRVTMASGSVSASLGRGAPALERFRQAYDIFAAAHDPRGQAMALQNIGSLYQDAGRYPEVLDCYARASAIYPADAALQVSASNNMGNALKAMHRYGEAEAQFRRAVAVSRQMGSAVLETRILTNLAATEVQAGELKEADDDLVQALALTDRDAGAREWRPFIWGVAAQAAFHRGDLRTASLMIERTFQGADVRRTEAVYRDFHQTASQIYAELGDTRLAAQHQAAFQRLSAPAQVLPAVALR